MKVKNLQRRGLEKKYLSKYKAINMNYGNEDTRYFGGIPSSIISYSSDRGRYQAYDGIYDTTSTTSQQLTTLQNQIATMQTQILNLQNTRVSQTLSSNPNLIANGDCSQYTQLQPTVMTCNAGVNNTGYIMQGRAVPIQDRWYNVAELSGANPVDVKCEFRRVLLSSYINPSAEYGSFPFIGKYGMSVKWINATGASTSMFTLEHTKSSGRNVNKGGAMMAVQHMVPDVTLTANQSYSLGFWLYSSYTGAGYVRILRQYNTNGGGGNTNTGNSLQQLLLQQFSVASGWNYITASLTTSALRPDLTISGINGLVVQIGPFYYTWKEGTPVKSELYGSVPTGASSFEWVLTEIQLRTDTIAAKNNYAINLRERENCIPYICATSPSRILSYPACSTYDRILTGSVTHTYSFFFRATIDLPTLMKEAPTYLIWQDTQVKIGSIFKTGDTLKNQGDVYRQHWGGLNLYGLLNNYDVLKVTITGVSNRIDSTPTTTDIHVPGDKIEVKRVTESSFEMSFFRSYVMNTASVIALAVPEGMFLYSDVGYSGRFVAIVPETHMGKDEYSETITYVDFSWTALTSRPFSSLYN